LDEEEEEAVPKRYQAKSGKQLVHKEPTKKKRKGAATPRKEGRVNIREPAVRPSGRRYVASSDSNDVDVEETLQHRMTHMATPSPTTRASSQEA